jgi:septum site-determining protein MinD
MKTKIIGIVSVKGGVGKTTLTSNLGAVLAERFEKKVLLVDANFSAPNLGMHLGVVNPKDTIHEVFKGEKHIFDVVHNFEDLFHFVPASMQSKRVKWDGFKKKLRSFRGKYDYILLDASPSREIDATINAAHSLLVVLTPDFPTVSTTVGTVNLIEKSKKPVLGLVLNKVKNKRFELSKDEIEETLGYSVVSTFSDDKKMLYALSEMRPFTLVYPRRKLTRQYVELASFLTDEAAIERKGFFSRFSLQ